MQSPKSEVDAGMKRLTHGVEKPAMNRAHHWDERKKTGKFPVFSSIQAKLLGILSTTLWGVRHSKHRIPPNAYIVSRTALA